ncbi:hypothetical protein [Streptomyces mesophilus]|uniref:hypothetical protein n=1 Tax=Streptomyces mesophilus TaxID=1775132 RepID=UPI00332D61A0
MRGRGLGHRLLCLLVLTGLALLAACGSAPDAQPGPTVSKPMSKSPGCTDQPELTGDGHLDWSGGTGRFQLAMRGSDCPAGVPAQLVFSIAYGVTPDGAKLEFRETTDSAWRRIPLHMVDPGESDPVESSVLPLAFEPHETKTYDVRLTLDRPPEDVRAFQIVAGLSATAGAKRWWESDLVFQYHSGQSVEVTAPASLTPRGGWAEFEVEVRNNAPRQRLRLDLATNSYGSDVVHETAEFEQFLAGRWVPLAGDFPATADFSLAEDAHKRFRFRLRIETISNRESDSFGVSARLHLVGESPGRTPLAFDGKPVKLVLPTFAVKPTKPFRKKSGAWGELRFTVENRTGVPYPPLHVEFSMAPDPPLGRMEYRAEDSDEWIELPTTEHDHRVTFPVSRGPVPDGYRKSYLLRVTMDHAPDQHFNWWAALGDADVAGSVAGIDGKY